MSCRGERLGEKPWVSPPWASWRASLEPLFEEGAQALRVKLFLDTRLLLPLWVWTPSEGSPSQGRQRASGDWVLIRGWKWHLLLLLAAPQVFSPLQRKCCLAITLRAGDATGLSPLGSIRLCPCYQLRAAKITPLSQKPMQSILFSEVCYFPPVLLNRRIAVNGVSLFLWLPGSVEAKFAN